MLHRPLDPPVKPAGDEERVPAGDEGDMDLPVELASNAGKYAPAVTPPIASFAGLTGEPIWPA